MKRCIATACLCFILFSKAFSNTVDDSVTVFIDLAEKAPSRVVYGADLLQTKLRSAGYKTVLGSGKNTGAYQILVHRSASSSALLPGIKGEKESFSIQSLSEKSILISGTDASGAMYGCMELGEIFVSEQGFPSDIHITDQPEMVLRGACIGLQKSSYLPGRAVYEYPYTPETFPWFYDKQHWISYLDSLAVNRFNSLYLWNGHPFASLVKLKDYPYALEVDEAVFRKNEEMFRFITTEADKRGIWIIQMFYNIIVSKPFAEKHGIKTQERERPILPIVADYTRKSIAAFVEKYPNVGLLVTLGEAMEGVGQDDVDWFTKTIIPGVKDGLKALKKTAEPPVVLRAHDTDAPMVMAEAQKVYGNLYTMAKYNGEALTTYTPRGKWAELHRTLSSIGTVHIENVHILANLEPFRYASADFIQKSVQAMHSVYGANGLHLYPQASYWDWPYAADSAGKKLMQVERDWLWYKQWARYAWNCHRNREEEKKYWHGQLASFFGMRPAQAAPILEAMEETGEIAPKLLRRFGITDGNRQTLTLGMQMSQLVNPFRFGLFTLMYESEAPEGEMLTEYAEKDWKGMDHTGETPVVVIREVKEHAEKAVAAIDMASEYVSKNKDEFQRWYNDVYIYRALAYHYAFKAEAALHALRYKYSNDVNDLRLAAVPLEQSVVWYRKLTEKTNNSYRYANSMQTMQRKIPFRGVDATFIHWREVLPFFVKELDHLNRRIDSLQRASVSNGKSEVRWWLPAQVQLERFNDFYTPAPGGKPFSDSMHTIQYIVPEIASLKAIQLNAGIQKNGTQITFETKEKISLLVGYFSGNLPGFARPPQLETNASANDYGQAEPKILNALVVAGLPPVNIHTYTFPPGKHAFRFEKGTLLLLGFTRENNIKSYDAGWTSKGKVKEVDWIFE